MELINGVWDHGGIDPLFIIVIGYKKRYLDLIYLLHFNSLFQQVLGSFKSSCSYKSYISLLFDTQGAPYLLGFESKLK